MCNTKPGLLGNQLNESLIYKKDHSGKSTDNS